MKFIRRLLYPFSVIYNVVTFVRNLFFDSGIFRSNTYKTPIIAVGNLSVGGTGKTPQIEYLINLLSSFNLEIATISRGYKRKSKGMLLANTKHSAEDLGDEPFQFFTKFPKLNVVVSADRRVAIDFLENSVPSTNVILLDDAMQHRKVRAGFYVMLTSFNDFFYDDFVLPAGNLREARRGAKRANCIIVTKCPDDLSDTEIFNIKNKVKKYAENTPVYFSKISYSSEIFSKSETINLNGFSEPAILLAGIAKPKPFFSYLSSISNIKLTFPDHHAFTAEDIKQILVKANGKKIITTEKDYMRLLDKIPKNQLFYLPIHTEFLKKDKEKFNSQVIKFMNL